MLDSRQRLVIFECVPYTLCEQSGVSIAYTKRPRLGLSFWDCPFDRIKSLMRVYVTERDCKFQDFEFVSFSLRMFFGPYVIRECTRAVVAETMQSFSRRRCLVLGIYAQLNVVQI